MYTRPTDHHGPCLDPCSVYVEEGGRVTRKLPPERTSDSQTEGDGTSTRPLCCGCGPGHGRRPFLSGSGSLNFLFPFFSFLPLFFLLTFLRFLPRSRLLSPVLVKFGSVSSSRRTHSTATLTHFLPFPDVNHLDYVSYHVLLPSRPVRGPLKTLHLQM